MAKQLVTEIISAPGVRRDGTDYDSPYYKDAQWVRFQRGRPRKMGGYRAISTLLTGPIRDVYVDSRTSVTSIHTFSPWGVERLQVDTSGAGGAIYDRTPAGFTRNDNYTWQSTAMYSQTGSPFTALIASAAPDLNDIASDTAGGIYAGDITGTSSLAAIADGSGPITVSGGCVVLQPFLFVYGSNGLIRNSNANDYSVATGWSGTNANSANPCGTKILRGLPMRGGGASPAGLFWALDSLIRVTYAGGTVLWNYDTVSSSITVLSKASIIEYDGLFFWAGVDRFFVYNGVVQELPNQMNLNWFFENLNFTQRQKVWAMKVPRFGEIWWFYPRGSATECTHAVIYNVREQTWYDIELGRSAGFESQVFQYPAMAGIEDSQSSTYVTYTPVAGTFAIGETVTGGTSGATGTLVKILSGKMNFTNVTGSIAFESGETITGSTSGATGTLTSNATSQELDAVWQHEFGVDKISGQNVSAIKSHYETTNFSFKTGGAMKDVPPSPNQTRLVRVEPDFVQSGSMNMYVEGGSYPNSENEESDAFVFDSTTEHLDPREQRGIMSLKFESNEIGGNFQMGKVIVTLEEGDLRG
jgi:hypothetical protein